MQPQLEEIYEAYKIDAAFEHLRKQYKFIPGMGNENADIVFVGEAPGGQEDREGKPFVGPSGKLINKKLKRIGLTREDVFVTNVLKYRPSDFNRDPSIAEIQASKMYLGAEISVINPKIIIALGVIPLKALMPGTPIKEVRGRIIKFGGYKLLVTYHPSLIIRERAFSKTMDAHFDLIKGVINGSNAA